MLLCVNADSNQMRSQTEPQGSAVRVVILFLFLFLFFDVPFSDAHYATVRAELDTDAQDLEAESWSLAVEQQHVKKHAKEMVKRQDVIYGECGL